MATSINPVNLLQRWKGASSAVVSAIQGASARTGVSFDYLMNKAQQESSFDPKAKASTSSATGLFQFIDSTWISAVKNYGSQFGIGNLSSQISSDGSIADPQAKAQIMKLREDPAMASNMVAAMTKDNANYLESSLGGKVGQTDLYMAHFLGLGGADKFLHARQENAMQPAANLFPAAANANRNVFYDASGRKKTVEEVYQFFAKKMDPASAGNPVTLVAANNPASSASPVMIRPAGQGFTLPVDNGQIDSADPLASNTMGSDRHLLETLLAGVDKFGVNQASPTAGLGKLLSPYTAMVMAKMQSPDEVAGSKALSHKDRDKKEQGASDHFFQKSNNGLEAAFSV